MQKYKYIFSGTIALFIANVIKLNSFELLIVQEKLNK